MTTYVKIVKGATKIKVAAPKPKYIEPIILGTSENDSFKTTMSALHDRLGETAWSIVYKALLVLHIMIREGEKDVTLKFLSKHQEFFNVQHMKNSRGPETKSLLRYAKYLSVKSKQFQATGIDYVRDEQENSNKKVGRLRNITVEKGLLREVESVELQIQALLTCYFTEAEVNNEIVLTCFRMLVNDLLNLFQALNEGVINILEHYFEMSKFDAERALEIYKDFVVLTTDVVSYLRIAKHLEYATKLHVPTIRHAPTALAKSLEEYLRDTSFEANRSQYLAEQEFKSNPIKKIEQKSKDQPKIDSQNSAISNPWANQIQVQFTQNQAQPQAQIQGFQQLHTPGIQQQYTTQIIPQSTGNPFIQPVQNQNQAQTFQSQQLQQFQQAQQPVQQPTGGLQPLQSFKTGDFSSVPNGSLVPNFTSAGFGNGIGVGVTPQLTGSNPFLSSLPLQQNQQAQITQPLESTKTGNNPFGLTYKPQTLDPIEEQKTNNPFSIQNTGSVNPFSLTQPQPQQQQQSQSQSQQQPQFQQQPQQSQTFAQQQGSSQQLPLASQSTGTNPFQSQYTSNRISIAKPTTFGGFENLQTTPVFPQTIQEQRTLQFNQQAGAELQQQINQNGLPLNGGGNGNNQYTGQFNTQYNGAIPFNGTQNVNYGGYNGPSLI